MAFSSGVRNKYGGKSKILCWFKAQVHPHKEEIYICPDFLKKYESKINFKYYGWIRNPNKGCTMVVFKWKNDQCFISDGRVVARRNGFKVPTSVTLYFEGEDNKFAMLPANYEGRYSLPDYSSNGWSFNPSSRFQTVISPFQARIDICPTFLKNFESILNFSMPVSIRNRNKQEAETLLKRANGISYLTGGAMVAKTFGFKKPTSVFLDFQFKDNLFLMIEKTAGKTAPIVEAVAEKSPVIILSSESEEDDDDEDDEDDDDDDDDEDDEDDDDDDDEDHDDDDDDKEVEFMEDDDDVLDRNAEQPDANDEDPNRYNHFDVKITESLAYSNQVMHFPNKTSRHVIPKNQTQIYIRDISTGRVTNCSIKTSNRYKHEKYLGQGWYRFKDEFALMPGDVLKCSIEDPPQYMNVMIIRGA